MRVGIYFDLRNPPGWATDWSRLYGCTLEMCEEADRHDCRSIWLREHHLFDDGYHPQPLTFAAATAARTSTARIGTAIVTAPLHHPVELDGAARDLLRLWEIVTPRPVQERVPIWRGYQGPKVARRARLLGERLLSSNSRLWPEYRAGLVEAGHDPSIGRMAGGVNRWVAEDPEADWPLVSRHVAAQLDSYRCHMVEGTQQPIPTDRPRRAAQPRVTGTAARHDPLRHTGGVDRSDQARRGGRACRRGVRVGLGRRVAEDRVAKGIQTIRGRLAPLLASYVSMAAGS